MASQNSAETHMSLHSASTADERTSGEQNSFFAFAAAAMTSGARVPIRLELHRHTL